MNEPKEAWITGIGIVSSLGEGLDAHWDALHARRSNVDDKRFAPFIVHRHDIVVQMKEEMRHLPGNPSARARFRPHCGGRMPSN